MSQASPATLSPLDASKLTIERNLTPPPIPENPEWGCSFTPHMLQVKHTPGKGWGAPRIMPYGPLTLSPASAVFHYSTSLFEGMKAYKSPESDKPRLFRPDKNMARLNRSAARVSLPTFDGEALLSCIKTLVALDKAYVPASPATLYIRPTLIGTRPSIQTGPSDDCLLYVIMCPVASMFGDKGFKPISLLANPDVVRSWPGGFGNHKLAANYGPTFVPQQIALDHGYDQNLWVRDDKITECGGMNFFAVYEDEEKVTHLITAPLNGEILPGVTRDSILALTRAHIAGTKSLPGLPAADKFVVEEKEFTLEDLRTWGREGRFKEAFACGTAAVIGPIERIGVRDASTGSIEDITVPVSTETGYGPIAQTIHGILTGIQEGRVEGPEGWSVLCE